MGFAGGGDNNVTISINGNSMGLVDALNIASEKMTATAERMATVGDASKALGAATASSAEGWAAAGAGAEQYAAQLEYLKAQLAETRARMEQMATTMGGTGGGGGGAFVRGGGGTIGLFSRLGDGVEMAAGKMMGFIEQAGAMVAGLISFSVLNDVIQEVQGFTDALVSLNVQTEKNVFAWKYLYGGMANAQGMAEWTKKFSMQIPYTRQDLLNAITNLAPMGLSPQGLEHYMPVIADLAATRAPNMNLAQIAQVVMSASMGYTRMLKYDLKINPEDLIKYGLDASNHGVGIHINDVTTLLPALENYAKAKGLKGAAQDIAHQTFWGSWSSFIDRIQNFELDTGHGLFGSLKKALNDLSSWIDTHADQIARFSDMIGTTLAGAFKNAASWVGELMTGFGQSGLFGEGGALSFLLPHTGPMTYAQSHPNAPKASKKGVTHPPNQTAAHLQHVNDALDKADKKTVDSKYADPSFWQQLGKFVGDASKSFGDAWSEMSQFVTNLPGVGDLFKSIADNLQAIGNAISQGGAGDGLKTIFKILMGTTLIALAPLIGLVALVVAIIANFHRLGDLAGWLGDRLGDFFGWLGTHIGDLLGQLGKWKDQALGKLGELKDNLVTWAGDLKDKALTWGQDMLAQFIQGIKNKVTDVVNAAKGVGQAIHDHLGFSKPKLGPLADADTYMPDMMALYAQGIRNGTPGLVSALSGVASTIAGVMRPSGGYHPAGSAAAGAGGGTMIVINGSSTLDVLKVIDHALAQRDHGVNVAVRAPTGYGYYQFGTQGGR